MELLDTSVIKSRIIINDNFPEIDTGFEQSQLGAIQYLGNNLNTDLYAGSMTDVFVINNKADTLDEGIYALYLTNGFVDSIQPIVVTLYESSSNLFNAVNGIVMETDIRISYQQGLVRIARSNIFTGGEDGFYSEGDLYRSRQDRRSIPSMDKYVAVSYSFGFADINKAPLWLQEALTLQTIINFYGSPTTARNPELKQTVTEYQSQIKGYIGSNCRFFPYSIRPQP